MAQSLVKCLPHKREDISSDPGICLVGWFGLLVLKPCPSNLSTGEVEAEGRQGPGQPV